MIATTALSYLVAGFIGAVILVYFVLQSARALVLLRGSADGKPPGGVVVGLGGLGLVVPVIVYLSLLAAEDLRWATGLLAGGAILVLVGMWNDLWMLRPVLRWSGQATAVAVVLWFIEPPHMGAGSSWLLTSVVGAAVWWNVNVFIGMDRIDGLAALQGLLFCAAVQLLANGIPGWVGDLTWLIAGTGLGSLVYNWPPAKAAMGSVGSGLLGLLLAVVSVQLWQSDLLPLVACLILLAGFWFDACYAPCVRMLSGQAFAPARSASMEHGGHLFHTVAARKGQAWTLVAYMAYFLCWLMPLAWLSLAHGQFGLLLLVLAVLPLALAARFLRVGMTAPDEG